MAMNGESCLDDPFTSDIGRLIDSVELKMQQATEADLLGSRRRTEAVSGPMLLFYSALRFLSEVRVM